MPRKCTHMAITTPSLNLTCRHHLHKQTKTSIQFYVPHFQAHAKSHHHTLIQSNPQNKTIYESDNPTLQVIKIKNRKKTHEMDEQQITTNMRSSSSSLNTMKFPGFRFSPTDEELISYYLKKKIEGLEKSVEVIPEIEMCRWEPWDLPSKSVIESETEWFFFSPRGRKYPNGSQSKRATQFGYWKATGKERNVVKSNGDVNHVVVIGTKRTLVFHMGRAPKGQRTEWIMHEYSMHGNNSSQDSLVVCRLKKNTEFRLNDSASNQRLPTTDGPSDSVSEVEPGNDQITGIINGASGVECSPKKCSSSYGSHSIEQVDSEVDEQQPTNEVSQPSSSIPNSDCDNTDDFYADILKDDIIKLDETSLSIRGKQPMQTPSTSQGTANRRIRLKKLEAESSQATSTLECSTDSNTENRKPVRVFRSFTWKTGNGGHSRAVVSIVIVSLVFSCVCCLSLLGGFDQVKAIN